MKRFLLFALLAVAAFAVGAMLSPPVPQQKPHIPGAPYLLTEDERMSVPQPTEEPVIFDQPITAEESDRLRGGPTHTH